MIRPVFVLTLALLFAACSLQPQRATQGWEAHQAQLLKLEGFHAEGRLAYRNANQGMNANFSWENDPRGFALQLSGPFGAGAVRINYRDGQLYINEHGQDQLMEAISPSQLLFENTGLWLPVGAFAYWVTGIPVPGEKFEYQLNEQQQLQQLQQDGWTIAYTRYTQVGALWLPDRITLTRDSIRIRLVIDRWTV